MPSARESRENEVGSYMSSYIFPSHGPFYKGSTLKNRVIESRWEKNKVELMAVDRKIVELKADGKSDGRLIWILTGK